MHAADKHTAFYLLGAHVRWCKQQAVVVLCNVHIAGEDMLPSLQLAAE
jgi:hypothetical protein